MSNHFQILYGTQQWYCHVLYKISNNWVIMAKVSFGQMRFHKILVQDAFWRDILYMLCRFIFYLGTVVLDPARIYSRHHVKSSPPAQNDSHFADDIYKYIFLNEKFYILIWISLKFIPKGPIDYMPPLVQVIAWCGTGDKPLPQCWPMSLTHKCGTRDRWVKETWLFWMKMQQGGFTF